MKETPKNKREARSKSVVAPAFYPGKEQWKCKPGNRYTAEELEAMEQNWEIRITKPAASHIRSGD